MVDSRLYQQVFIIRYMYYIYLFVTLPQTREYIKHLYLYFSNCNDYSSLTERLFEFNS